MLRIASAPPGISAMSLGLPLARAIDRLTEAGQSLATLERIRAARDDPAGLFAVEQLRGELATIAAASRNASRARSLVALADGQLSIVDRLLAEIRDRYAAAADSLLSGDQRVALLGEVEASVGALGQIAATTRFLDQSLFDGSFADPPTARASLLALFAPPLPEDAEFELPDLRIETLRVVLLGSSLVELFSVQSSDGDERFHKALEFVEAARQTASTARIELAHFERAMIEPLRGAFDSLQGELVAGINTLFDADVSHATAAFVRAQIVAQSAVLSLRAGGDLSYIDRLLDLPAR